MFRTIILAATLPLLAGCSAISALGDAATPMAVLELRPPALVQPAPSRVVARDVIIEVPTTGGALSTDRIMIRPSPLEAQYLPGVRWSEDAPVMVQTLMLRTLDATQSLRYVGRRPLGAGGDFAIVTELVDFQAELSADGLSARVDVGMIIRVVRERDVRIVASRTFNASALSPSLDDAALSSAFNTATAQVMTEFADWALAAVRGG